MGPQTGRGMGPCGRGMGCGRGYGRGMGYGRGLGYGRYAAGAVDETTELAEAERFHEQELAAIRERKAKLRP